MSQEPREGEQSLGGAGAAEFTLQLAGALGWCLTFDLPDLNPRPAAGLDPQLWEKEWDEMINSFGLVMHGNISICIDCKLQTRISVYS